jgi:predicted transcriptional regulator
MSITARDELSAKQRIRKILDEQPDDASYEELLRELAFNRMVDSGLADARAGRSQRHEKVSEKIKSWRS